MSFVESEQRAFSYQAKWTALLAGFIFFAASGVSLVSLVDGNDRDLRLTGLIHLTAEQASAFYLLLAAASFVMLAVACMSIVTRVAGSHRLVLTADGVYAPRWLWSHDLTFIRYADIQSLNRCSIRTHEFLTIIHANGRLTISADKLPSPADFADLCSALDQRAQNTINGPATA